MREWDKEKRSDWQGRPPEVPTESLMRIMLHAIRAQEQPRQLHA